MAFAIAGLVLVGLAAVGVFRAWTGRWPILGASEGGWQAGRLVASGFAGLVIVALAIQVVPYGRDHSNPPVRAEPQWGSPRTAELVRRAGYDCHSNEVEWPWYSSVAPMSWIALGHGDEGRDELNFSEWDREQEIDEIVESVVDGEMPTWDYRLINSKGRLSEAEKDELIRGLRLTFGSGEEGDEDDDHDDDD